MLSEKQVKEIREHLEKAQNPIYLFDNDQDGLCSFLLLQRHIERGKGVAIKSFPDLSVDYFRRVRELGADYIFILDKAFVSEEFFNEARQYNIPVVWIDHHETDQKIPDYVNYYNPVLEGGITESTSLFCYQVSQKKDDLWIAVIGCISDAFVPEFYSEFKEKYPDLVNDSKEVLDIYFNSELGKIGKILGAGLKDKTTNVVAMLKFLMKAKSPYEVLEESKNNYYMHKRFNDIDKKYRKLLEKASVFAKGDDKILFFEYSGELSISSDVANGLKQKYPRKIIVVGYMGDSKVNISIRGEKIKEVLLKVIGEFEDATGGGHEMAVGAKVKLRDWMKFKERFRELMK